MKTNILKHLVFVFQNQVSEAIFAGGPEQYLDCGNRASGNHSCCQLCQLSGQSLLLLLLSIWLWICIILETRAKTKLSFP